MKKFNADRLFLELRRSAAGFALFVGFCIVGGVIAAIVFKNLTFERPFKDYQTVNVAVDDVKGVAPGKHQVRISGVKAGVVSEAELVDGEPVLKLQIERKFAPLYRDAKLRIRPVTPLQDLYVNVTDRGTPAAGEADEDVTIAAERTLDPVDVSRVLDTFNADTRERMKILLGEFGPALQDGGAKLREAFVTLAPFLSVAQDATEVLAEREENVARLVDNFGGLSESLARRDTQLTKLVRSGNVALGELAANDGPFGATLGALPSTLEAMRTSFSSLRTLSGELDPTLNALRPVTQKLDSGLGGLEEFGEDATPALRALRPAVGDLRSMARTVVPTSQSLRNAFTKLRGQAPHYDQLTQELIPCLDTMQDFLHHTLSVFKFANALSAFPRAEMTIDLDGFTDGKVPGNLRRVPTCVKKDG